MKKLVEAVLYDNTGKMIFAYTLKTSTIKTFAGIKHIAELEDDADAQVQLDDTIILAAKRFAKKYAGAYGITIDHIVIYNDYANTAKKYSIR